MVLAADMERLGVATASELSVETLVERITQEMAANQSVIIGRAEIGAWSRVQGVRGRGDGRITWNDRDASEQLTKAPFDPKRKFARLRLNSTPMTPLSKFDRSDG